ncbi:MAG TPA: hypothetical protein VNT77_03250 [Allosphingosinicella sp.]|nr:hypothetical protein [Allosphingosinicella sp.]
MPYPRAHYYVLVCMAVIVAGFWPSYFAELGNVPWQFHAHGVAASIWVFMVFAQSWTAHHKPQLPLHRAVGKSSLLLFPFLIGGLFAIIDVTANKFAAGRAPVTMMAGGSFLLGLMVAVAAYVLLYYRALKYRRKVWLHSGYMLATPLILWESPFSRLLGGFMPGLTIRGPQDFGRIIPSIEWAMATALLFCIVVRWRVGERAHPFTVAGILIAIEMAAMGFLGNLPIVRSALVLIGDLPSATVVMTGFAIGAATSWAGWQAGKRPATTTGLAAQVA